MGWRYLLFTLGGMTLLLWAIRFFVFPLEESPRFLVGLGRDADAVAVVQRIAAFNGRPSTLTVDQLARAGEAAGAGAGASSQVGDTASKRQVLSKSSVFTSKHVKSLFETPKLAWSTSLLIALWGTYSGCRFVHGGRVACRAQADSAFFPLFAGIIGLASTLYNSFLPFLCVFATRQALSFMGFFLGIVAHNFGFFRLASRGAQFGDSSYYITYRNVSCLRLLARLTDAFFHRAYLRFSLRPSRPLACRVQQVILGVIGVPGAFLAGWAVEQPYIGRKGTLAISAGEYSVLCTHIHYSTTPC